MFMYLNKVLFGFGFGFFFCFLNACVAALYNNGLLPVLMNEQGDEQDTVEIVWFCFI